MIQTYFELKDRLDKNNLLIYDDEFNYNFNELVNCIRLELEDFLYNHIEWEHIELEAFTSNLSELKIDTLIELALNFDYSNDFNDWILYMQNCSDYSLYELECFEEHYQNLLTFEENTEIFINNLKIN